VPAVLFQRGDGEDDRRIAVEGVNGRPGELEEFHADLSERAVAAGWLAHHKART
jgi:hypothetical protein